MKQINSFITGTLFASVLALSAAVASADQHGTVADEPDDYNDAAVDEHKTNESRKDMEATFVTSKEGRELLAGELMGNDVHSTVEDDESIGTVDDFLLSEDGEIKAVIISVGGFLGIGDKDIAVAWDSLELTQEDDEYVIKVNASQDALENAPEFEKD